MINNTASLLCLLYSASYTLPAILCLLYSACYTLPRCSASLRAGQLEAAMKTAIKCCEYDDVLEPRDIYSLLSLTALRNKFYGICSKAFVKVGGWF